MKGKVFVVSEFKNPSGEIVYRLYGRVDGERIRKNFATRAEAEAERQTRELARLQGASGMRLAATRLTNDQLQQAEGAFALIQGKSRDGLTLQNRRTTNLRHDSVCREAPRRRAGETARVRGVTDLTMPASFIGIDWGSTNARAFLFARDGRVLERGEFPLGIKAIAPGGFPAAFDRMIAPWRARHGELPAVLSGMVGSRQGWREAPYLPCPAPLDSLAHALVPVPDTPGVKIVPGLMMPGDRPDVMRGEELQLLGLGAEAAQFDFVCIPGTHSKWILTDGRAVREFRTAMTGELFSAIEEHTLLAPLIPAAAKSAPWHETAFVRGLDRSAAPHALLTELFALRAGALLGRLAADEIRDQLSGLLIGTEIRAMLPLVKNAARIAVIGATALSDRYVHALRKFALAPTAFDPAEMSARGFAALLRE